MYCVSISARVEVFADLWKFLTIFVSFRVWSIFSLSALNSSVTIIRSFRLIFGIGNLVQCVTTDCPSLRMHIGIEKLHWKTGISQISIHSSVKIIRSFRENVWNRKKCYVSAHFFLARSPRCLLFKVYNERRWATKKLVPCLWIYCLTKRPPADWSEFLMDAMMTWPIWSILIFRRLVLPIAQSLIYPSVYILYETFANCSTIRTTRIHTAV